MHLAARGTLPSGPFELGYVIEGRGPTALVIGSARYYPRTFSQRLREHLRLVFVDHRGFAPASRPVTQADFGLDQLLRDMEHARVSLGLGEVVVIGHSGHAYLALEYAKRYPHAVTRAVLIAAGPSQSTAMAELTERHWRESVCPERKAKQDAALLELPRALAEAPERRFITFCLRLGPRSWFDPDFDAGPLWEGVSVHMTMFDHVWGEVFRDLDITQGLEGLRAPVLLALGRFDYLVAPHFAWEPYRGLFRELTVRVFDRSGHTPQLEESEAFDRVLLDWLEP